MLSLSKILFRFLSKCIIVVYYHFWETFFPDPHHGWGLTTGDFRPWAPIDPPSHILDTPNQTVHCLTQCSVQFVCAKLVQRRSLIILTRRHSLIGVYKSSAICVLNNCSQ